VVLTFRSSHERLAVTVSESDVQTFVDREESAIIDVRRVGRSRLRTGATRSWQTEP
jgi:hypothetical protein